MQLMAAVVENLVKPAVLRGLLAWERRESGVAYDFISEEAKTDPYPTYRRLRTLDPVHRMRTIDAWALTRYRDVEAVLRDHARFANADRVFVETISMSLLELDPPRTRGCGCWSPRHSRRGRWRGSTGGFKRLPTSGSTPSTACSGSTWWRRWATRCRSP